jgi:predicted RNase H-like HicB family nuclease
MAAAMKGYRVVYEMDESGHWVATVPGVRGCHTYGRSLSEARARVREALGLFVVDASRAPLIDDVRLPVNIRRLVDRYKTARLRAERDAQQAAAAVRGLAKTLSRRDAAELLGISHQRVQQIAASSDRSPDQPISQERDG